MFCHFEGIEGAGKSTIARLVAAGLAALDTMLSSQGTGRQQPWPQPASDFCFDARNACLCSGAELHLFWPTGAQHLAEVIRPALEAEQIVLCDRYSDSHNRLSGAMAEAKCHMTSKGLSCSDSPGHRRTGARFIHPAGFARPGTA